MKKPTKDQELSILNVLSEYCKLNKNDYKEFLENICKEKFRFKNDLSDDLIFMNTDRWAVKSMKLENDSFRKYLISSTNERLDQIRSTWDHIKH